MAWCWHTERLHSLHIHVHTYIHTYIHTYKCIHTYNIHTNKCIHTYMYTTPIYVVNL